MKAILCILSLSVSTNLILAGPAKPQDMILKCKNEEMKIPEELKTAMRECYQEVFGKEMMERKKTTEEKVEKQEKPETKEKPANKTDMRNMRPRGEKLQEMASCKGKALAIIDSTGKVDKEKTLELIKEIFPSAATSEMTASISECLNKTNGDLNTKDDKFEEAIKCVIDSFYQICLGKENSSI